MNQTIIVDGARTPFGKFQGGLASLSASDLGGLAIEAALQKSGVQPQAVEQVILGTVLQAGQGQIPSRQAAHKANIPWSVPTETINKVCASGMRAVTLANQLIRLEDRQVIVAGGMESMSNAPYYLKKARTGLRMGDSEIIDGMIYDGLTCSFDSSKPHMGIYGNENAKQFNISREEQDEWAVQSHQRAGASIQKFAQEIVPVTISSKKGETVIMQDESIRVNTDLKTLANLRSAFEKEGTITAGNAPGVNDGACALILASEAYVKANGLNTLAKIVAHSEIAVEPQNFPQTPAIVIEALLEKAGKKLDEIDLFEMNEAFAAVALIGQKKLNIPVEKVNVNGGAIALGHPIGASGARIILTLAYELKRRGGGLGIAAICSGGGQGDAVLIEV